LPDIVNERLGKLYDNAWVIGKIFYAGETRNPEPMLARNSKSL